MSYSFSGERLPGTPEEDFEALFAPPPLMYSMELDDYVAYEPEEVSCPVIRSVALLYIRLTDTQPKYDDSVPPPGWVGVDLNAKSLQFGDQTVLPLTFIDKGKLALSRQALFTDWTPKMLPVGVHMLTLLRDPLRVSLAQGYRPFKPSDENTHIRLEIDVSIVATLCAGANTH